MSSECITLPEWIYPWEHIILKGFMGRIIFPDEMTIRGKLTLIDCEQLTELPESLRCEGSLSLKHCTNLRKLPKSLVVWCDLNIEGSDNIETFPEYLEVGGIFTISNVEYLDKISDESCFGNTIEVE